MCEDLVMISNISRSTHRPETLRKVLIIIPAFNEEAVIAKVVNRVRTIKSMHYKLHVCVVNDGSTDSTSEIAREISDVVIDLPINLGVGSAVRAGYQYALKHKFEFVIQIDADDQHNPEYIPSMIDKLSDHDHLVGSRYLDREGYKISKIVRAAQIIVSLLMYFLHGIRISDPTSGFRASGHRAIKLLADSYPTTFLQDTIGSIILVNNEKLVLGEINTPMKPRIIGQSSQGTLRRVRLYLLSILLIIFWR